MAFLQNSQALTSGVQVVEVVFATAFDTTPTIIIPVVSNVSADASKSLIQAEVTVKDRFGFTVTLTAPPPNGNYSLEWIAGSAELLFTVIARAGIKISALAQLPSGILDADYLPIVHTDPIPQTKRLFWGVLRAFFPNLQTQAPASPAADGEFGDIAVDGVWLYVHNGILWGRTLLFQSAWDVESGTDPSQKGVIALVQGQSYIDIAYPVEFSGNPLVNFAIRNLVDVNFLQLSGIQTVGSTTGARISFNTAPDSAHYELVWNASL